MKLGVVKEAAKVLILSYTYYGYTRMIKISELCGKKKINLFSPPKNTKLNS
jgi:hypothetical protein